MSSGTTSPSLFPAIASPAAVRATHRDEFSSELYFITLERGYWLSLGLLGLNLLLLGGFDLLSYRTGRWTNAGYHHAFIWRLATMSANAGYVYFYRMVRPATARDVRRLHRVLATAFVAWLFVCGTWLSITNQYIVTDVSIFAVAMLAAAVVFPLPNRFRDGGYFASFAGLLIGIRLVGITGDRWFSLLTNAGGVVILAGLLGRLTYRQHVQALVD
jgi:hypothetical protein